MAFCTIFRRIFIGFLSDFFGGNKGCLMVNVNHRQLQKIVWMFLKKSYFKDYVGFWGLYMQKIFGF